MLNFKKLHKREINGGVQYIAEFPNGYGASIVQHQYSYGGKDGKWELAVISNIVKINNKYLFDLNYTTPITNDVLGYLSEEDVNKYLELIKDLPKH